MVGEGFLVGMTFGKEQNAIVKGVESGIADPAEPKSLKTLTRKNIEVICELQ